MDERHGHVVLEHGEPGQQQQHEYNIIVNNTNNIKMVRVRAFSATANLGKNRWGKKAIRWTLDHSRKLVGK